ncbi:trypsin-like serine peptidase [Maliponia aquimaris]|uniref:Serine protease n=1 Tax=Maliponia aquimaris TaxID=1673631 RepID=A0A238L5N8_9RHOB|nr:trypsin-like serine protease [Maliponia aquimaris]SMX50307.1 Glutamyl endopeptidase precursor [Maliponia aquimaris]
MTVGGVIRTPLPLDRMVEAMDYAVLGPFDGRWRVRNVTPPLSSVCHVERDFGSGRLSGSTGFLIGDRVVVTAGHCLYSPLRRRGPRRILVTAGRNGPHRPFGAIWAQRWYAHPAFVTQTNPLFDYGVIILPRGFPGLRPALRLTAPGTAELVRARDSRLAHIAGYPSDKRRGELWCHAERMDRIGRRLIAYSVDTCPGHSGAPVWLDTGGGRRDVIAIHTRGPRPSGRGPWGCRPGAPMAPVGHFNTGIRITPTVRRAIIDACHQRGVLQRITN